jgi:hypothetical protein
MRQALMPRRRHKQGPGARARLPVENKPVRAVR